MTTTNKTPAAAAAPAGRCIRFLRPHKWTKWETFPGHTGGLIRLAASRQRRTCTRCGWAQETAVTQ